jgi:DNA invertase Pin-like site-specific DNA recombinase
MIAELGERGVSFRRLSGPIDTTSAGGRRVMHNMGAPAAFERSLIVERTKAGLPAAKRQGTKFGQPVRLIAAQTTHAKALMASGENGGLWREALASHAQPIRHTEHC